MVLLVITLAIAFVGIISIEFAQPSRSQDGSVWNDDLERRLLRVASGRNARW